MSHASSRRRKADLASLEALPPALEAVWTVSSFGREPLFVLSGRFGKDAAFCSRFVVFPTMDGSKWIVLALIGEEDFTRGGLSRLSRQILNQAQATVEGDPNAMRSERRLVLGAAADCMDAQRLCVEYAVIEARAGSDDLGREHGNGTRLRACD